MGKYDTVQQKPKAERPWEIHPIWRGIGCILLLLLPFLSYLTSVLLVEANIENQWMPIPEVLAGPPQIPFLFAHLVLTLFFVILLFGFLMIFYSLIYTKLGPPKYGPTDAPPPRIQRVRKEKKKTKNW
jgi:hypothetical protein